MSNQKNTFRHIGDDMKALIMNNRGGQQVIERIVAAYGFTSRQAFCNHLGISQSTMANRYARDTFPADWVILCSLETGVCIEWLAFGRDTKSQDPTFPHDLGIETNDSIAEKHEQKEKSPIENFINPNHGGKAAIERLVEAYGFKTRQALADHLNVSKSTLANRYLRDTFPSDWIIQCALETGSSLTWLATGLGQKLNIVESDIVKVSKFKLEDGKIISAGHLILDKALLPTGVNQLIAIVDNEVVKFATQDFNDLEDGSWLIQYEKSTKLKELYILPGGKLRISDANVTFECNKVDIKAIAKILTQYSKI